MFKTAYMGAVEGMKCFSLTSTGNLRRYLMDHLDTVQLAAAAGMPTGDVRVSENAHGAVLRYQLRVPSPYCRAESVEIDLSYEMWHKAIDGDFEFLQDRLMQSALRLIIGTPVFFHTRITQYKRMYLYTFCKEVRTVLRECCAVYQEQPQDGLPPMDEIFKREDLCLMLRRRDHEYLLTCVSDDQEILLGSYAEKSLFKPEETLESILWRCFNEYMRDTYKLKVSSVMILKFGSKMRTK